MQASSSYYSSGTVDVTAPSTTAAMTATTATSSLSNKDLSSGVLLDVLMRMCQKIESLTLFDSDMMRLAAASHHDILPSPTSWHNDSKDEYHLSGSDNPPSHQNFLHHDSASSSVDPLLQ